VNGLEITVGTKNQVQGLINTELGFPFLERYKLVSLKGLKFEVLIFVNYFVIWDTTSRELQEINSLI
jgi:hypothetical protein